MSTRTNIIIVIIVLIGLGIWWGVRDHSMTTARVDTNTSQTPSASDEDVTYSSATSTASTTDTSNRALDDDMAHVDAQMSGLSSDNAAADKSFTQN